jgi:hypothetical protein
LATTHVTRGERSQAKALRERFRARRVLCEVAAETVRRDLRDLEPRDMIDIQSFIWVQGSDEYEEGS